MSLPKAARVEVLQRALRVGSRGLLDYACLRAPPIDIDRHPDVRDALAALLTEEEAVEGAIAAAIRAAGGRPEPGPSFDMRLPYYNYVTSDHALKVMGDLLAKSLARFEAVVDEAAADAALHELLRPMRDRKAAVVARVLELRRGLAVAGKRRQIDDRPPAAAADSRPQP